MEVKLVKICISYTVPVHTMKAYGGSEVTALLNNNNNNNNNNNYNYNNNNNYYYYY